LERESKEVLARHPAVQALLARRISEALINVSNWEQVKKFVVLTEPFTVEKDELTVSLKLRRNIVLARHAAELEALYQE
jgi:long-chain acyl-CoA synthetase